MTASENLWSFDQVIVGQRGTKTVVTVSAGDIEEYARVSQNPNPWYAEQGDVAMPMMLLSIAPLARENIAEHNGFVAYEVSENARRQTPFTKCECRWQAAIRAGDTITATRHVHEKYTRRGSNFVTFRVTGTNQHGQQVGEYDYTCIFDYAQGQRRDGEPKAPAATASAANTEVPPSSGLETGSSLATLTIIETQATMNAKDAFRLVGEPGAGSNIHTDKAFAKQNIFGTTVNSGPATMAFVNQLLEQNCGPFGADHPFASAPGKLMLRAIRPFRDGDAVTFAGTVTAGGTPGSRHCEITGTNQHGQLVCVSSAEVQLPA